MPVQRWLEMIALFICLPLGVALFLQGPAIWLMPLLVLISLLSFCLLLCDPNFKRFRLWHVQGGVGCILRQIALFLPVALVCSVLVYTLSPELFLRLPSQAPALWLSTLLVYPLVSVLPQELVFRTFFFHRYKQILPSKASRLGLSTLSFSLAHGVYGNWVAVGLSLLGGLLFGYRYVQTRSTLLVAFEHMLWGSFLFTIGLGVYLLSTPVN